MYFLKSDINQFEHLLTLLIFVCILIILSGHEANVILLQKQIDNYLGYCTNNNIENICNATIFNINYIKNISQVMKQWIIKDYKSSQCRKWIKWIKNKRAIIFSS